MWPYTDPIIQDKTVKKFDRMLFYSGWCDGLTRLKPKIVCLFVVFVVLKRCTRKYTFFYAPLKVVSSFGCTVYLVSFTFFLTGLLFIPWLLTFVS
jgi:hypothetical protein